MYTMTVTSRNGNVPIDPKLYRRIFENSILADHPSYLQSLDDGKIPLSQLITLCRQGKLAYSLFFGSYKTVAPMLDNETKQLFGGFGGKYSISVRGKVVSLNTIRLIIKDIKMKQSKIAQFVHTVPNKNVKYLKNSTRTLQDQATCIVDRLGLDMNIYRSYNKKPDALWYLIEKLEENGIFVSLENTGSNMPQLLKRAEGLTGVYVKHAKFPYFFIANEGLADFEDIPGRKSFTLIYLTVCLFKGSSRMVTLKQGIGENTQDELFKLVEMILMPEDLIPNQGHYTVQDLDDIAKSLNVTAFATLVRLRHIGNIGPEEFNTLKKDLFGRYKAYAAQQKRKREESKKKFQHNPTRNILAYQGKAFLRILRDQYRAKKITRRELNRQLAYGKGGVDVEKVFSNL